MAGVVDLCWRGMSGGSALWNRQGICGSLRSAAVTVVLTGLAVGVAAVFIEPAAVGRRNARVTANEEGENKGRNVVSHLVPPCLLSSNRNTKNSPWASTPRRRSAPAASGLAAYSLQLDRSIVTSKRHPDFRLLNSTRTLSSSKVRIP